TNEKFRNIVIAAWESIKDAFSVVVEFFKKAANSIAAFMESLPPEIVNAFNAAIEYTSALLAGISSYLSTAAGAVSGFVGSLASGTVDAFNKSLEWLGDLADTVGGFFVR